MLEKQRKTANVIVTGKHEPRDNYRVLHENAYEKRIAVMNRVGQSYKIEHILGTDGRPTT